MLWVTFSWIFLPSSCTRYFVGFPFGLRMLTMAYVGPHRRRNPPPPIWLIYSGSSRETESGVLIRKIPRRKILLLYPFQPFLFHCPYLYIKKNGIYIIHQRIYLCIGTKSAINKGEEISEPGRKVASGVSFRPNFFPTQKAPGVVSAGWKIEVPASEKCIPFSCDHAAFARIKISASVRIILISLLANRRLSNSSGCFNFPPCFPMEGRGNDWSA